MQTRWVNNPWKIRTRCSCRCSPDWDTTDAGSTPQSPVKRYDDHGFTLLCIILTLLNRRGGPQLPDTPMTPSPKWVLTPIIIQLYFWPSLYSKSVSKTKRYDITLIIRTDYLMDLQSEASKSSEWQWTVCSMIHLVYHLLIYSGSRASPTKRTKQFV